MPTTIISPTHAAPNMQPEYEVRLQLKPSAVLDSKHKLTETVLSSFNMPATATKLNVQFLDTNAKEIYGAGWSPRIRKTEDEDELELTYKKRHPITGDDINGRLQGCQVTGAADQAPNKFDDWKHEKWGTKTLSSSRVFGPVLARHSIGTWSGMKMFLEVWPLRKTAGSTEIEYIVEASFKIDSRTTAFDEQRRLADLLQSKGWFLPEDTLKTHLIMERY